VERAGAERIVDALVGTDADPGTPRVSPIPTGSAALDAAYLGVHRLSQTQVPIAATASPGCRKERSISMKLTRAASYALHAMVHIAGQKPNIPIASHQIAQAHDIPERFLLKVLKPLVSAGLLYSVKGPHGGYRLARSANQITVLDVIEGVEGPIRGHSTFHSNGSGLSKRLDQICHLAAEQTRKQFNKVSLASLAH